MPFTDIAGFRAAANESFVPLRVSSDRADEFRGSIEGDRYAELHLTRVRATSHTVERTPELIRGSTRGYLKISVMLEGSALLAQDGRETVLSPGDLAVYDTDRPYTLAFEQSFRTLVVMFPRELLRIPSPHLGAMTAVRIPGSTGLGAVATGFFTQLGDQHPKLAGATSVRLAQSALDLVTALFADELGIDRAPADPRAARVQEILAYVDDHLGDPELSPGSIAGAHFISTRHLHGLFSDLGETVSTRIRTRRLEQCRRDLADPLLAGQPVAVIAARWGFTDAAHFSRAFRAKFGESPRDARAH